MFHDVLSCYIYDNLYCLLARVYFFILAEVPKVL
jgi:hypothetical protein